MGDEAVEGSKTGTKLIMFVAIVVLALVAFQVGKTLVNTGVDNMEMAVGSINDSRFSDYDKKTVRGRTVKSAISTFANEGYAIIVCTLKMADDPTNIKNYTSGSTVTVKVNGSSMLKSDGTAATNVVGLNYNALLENSGSGGVRGSTALTLKDGVAIYDHDFLLDGAGNVQYYLNTQNLTRKGSGEYIADASSFSSNLIKNSAGEIAGIIFLQKKLY